MTQRIRLNAASDPIAGGPERITKGGEEYLRVPLVAGREQIYEYPDQPNAEDYEFLPGDELGDAVDRHNSDLRIVLDHPTAATPAGPTPSLLTQNSTSGTEVDGAAYTSLEETDGKARGNLDLPVSSRDAYGPAYKEAFDALESGDEWPVSLGYSVGQLEKTTGRHNGQTYSGVQRDLTLDHLALVMNGRARCSVADGCAAGRANAEQDLPLAAFGEPVVTDDSGDIPDERENALRRFLGAARDLFGDDVPRDGVLWSDETVRANAESKTVAGVTFTSKKSGKLDESSIPDDDFEGHYLFAAGTKSDSSYPVVDGSGALRKGNVSSAYQMGARGDVSEDDLHSKLKALNKQWSESERPIDFEERENASQYSEGDVVDYGDGTGVVLAVMTSDFTWPQGDEDEIDVEASSDSPMYVVARESGGSGVYEASELSSGSFDTEEPDLDDLRDNAVVPEWYGDLEDPFDYDEVHDAVRGNANIPGVDDPEVGFASGKPEGWTRKSYLQAYASLGGSWRSCVTEMTGDVSRPKRWCSALKDEVFGTERWRGGRFNATDSPEFLSDESADTDSGTDAGGSPEPRDGADTDSTTTMQIPDNPDDEQKREFLTQNGWDEENVPAAGEDCLAVAYQDRVNAIRANAESESDEEGDEASEDESEESEEQNEDEERENADTIEMTEEEFDKKLSEKVDERIDERQNAKQRDQQIGRITANSEWEAEDLEGMADSGLDKLEEQHTPERQNGMGGQAPARQADRTPMRTDGPMRANASDGEDLPPSSSDESYDAAVGGDD